MWRKGGGLFTNIDNFTPTACVLKQNSTHFSHFCPFLPNSTQFYPTPHNSTQFYTQYGQSLVMMWRISSPLLSLLSLSLSAGGCLSLVVMMHAAMLDEFSARQSTSSQIRRHVTHTRTQPWIMTSFELVAWRCPYLVISNWALKSGGRKQEFVCAFDLNLRRFFSQFGFWLSREKTIYRQQADYCAFLRTAWTSKANPPKLSLSSV